MEKARDIDRPAQDLDDYLDLVLVGGREHTKVEIVPYDPSWPERFDEECARILAALGPVALRLEHVGSTAVPELAAKPIVDVMVTVRDPDDESAYRSPLERAGYHLRVRESGHRMFRTPAKDVHVHIWMAGGEDEDRHVLFRDWLRANPADRQEYERLKRELAGRWRDVNYYARAKGPFITRIVEAARVSRDEGTHDLARP